MSQQVPLYITSGLPFGKTFVIELPTGRTWWNDTSEFEVLSEARDGLDDQAPLIQDLAQYMTVTFDDVDTVTIDFSMSGAETRLINKSGYYDVIMSDPLPIDERAIRILYGPIFRSALITSDTGMV